MRMGKIVWILLVFGTLSCPVLSQVDDLTIPLPSLVRVFETLEKKGEHDIENVKANNPKLNQFISFTVVSKHEVIQQVTIPESRIQTALNTERSSSENSRCSGRKVHGEISAIQTGNLSSAIETFQKEDHTTLPVVVLFSHYIPCYGIKEKSVKYSCAEELSNFFFAYQNKIKMIVVYRDVYEGTMKNMALRYMTADGIDVYEKTASGDYTKKYFESELTAISRDTAIFQQLFFGCLNEPDEEFIRCTIPCVGSKEHAVKIIAHFVNLATHHCTQDRANSARLSAFTKGELRRCLKNYIDEQISTDCTKCPKTSDPKLYVRYCSIYATHYSGYVGFNNSPFDSFSKNWIEKPMLWKDLYMYRKGFESFDKTRPAVYCALKQVNSRTLCSRIRRSGKHDEALRLEMRDLLSESEFKQRNN